MEQVLVAVFLMYPIYLLRQFALRQAQVDARRSSQADEAHYQRTCVPEDRC